MLTSTTQRLQWLLWALLAWVGRHFRAAGLAAGNPARRTAAPGGTAATKNRGRSQALRGSILDRTGQPLAKTLPAESVASNPQKIPDLRIAADLLSRILDVDRTQLYQRHHAWPQSRGSGFHVGEAQVSTPKKPNACAA